jgi:hypothetical protein
MSEKETEEVKQMLREAEENASALAQIAGSECPREQRKAKNLSRQLRERIGEIRLRCN